MSLRAQQEETWELYDDFNDDVVDPLKWTWVAEDGANAPIEEQGQVLFSASGPIRDEASCTFSLLRTDLTGVQADVQLANDISESFIDLEILAHGMGDVPLTVRFELDDGTPPATSTALYAVIESPTETLWDHQGAAVPGKWYELAVLIRGERSVFIVDGDSFAISPVFPGLQAEAYAIVSGMESTFGRALLDDVEVVPACASLPCPENPSFLRGDCNGDGQVTGQVTDAVFLLNYNFRGGSEPPCLAACDANGDGRVTGSVADAVYLLRFNFSGGPPPVPPYPDCGLGRLASDSTLGCQNPPAECP